MADPAYGTLSLGGVAIPAAARLTWGQRRQTVSSVYQLEYSDLSAEIQQGPTAATKQIIELSCEGWAPPGLDALSRTTTHAFIFEKCTAESVWTPTTITVWIWEPIQYDETPSAAGGGTVRWSLTLRQA